MESRLNARFIGPTRVHIPNGISIGSAIFADRQTDQQTERPRYSVCCSSCGSGLLRHGLNFSRVWRPMRLISGEKYWQRVCMQMVVSLITCSEVACLTSKLPHNTSRLFSQPPVFGLWRETITFHRMNEFCISQSSALSLDDRL